MDDVQLSEWRDRLKEEIDRQGISMRALSLDAKCGQSYVHQLIVGGKEPSVDKLMAIARVLGVSVSWLLYGVNLSRDREEILSLLEQNPEKEAALLQLLRAK